MGNDERTGVLAGGDRAVNEPALRVLPVYPVIHYGLKAVQGAKKVLPEASKAFAEFEPEFVDRARAEWNILLPELPRRDLMQNVTFKSLSQHPSEPIRNSGLHGWVNSSTEIYLAEPTKHRRKLRVDEPVWWRVILYHEALHVEQFAKHGGPPDTYTQMVKHEIEAYGKTADWLFDTDHPERYPSEQMHTAFRAMQGQELFFIDLEDSKKDSSSREQEYKDILVGNSYLPDHEDIKKLYGR